MRQHYAVASFQEHELRKAFAYFDTKGKGFLNRKQLYRALRNCGDQLSDEECDEFFSLADKNKDGVISLEGIQFCFQACYKRVWNRKNVFIKIWRKIFYK